jgi:hypothetical protein
MRARPQTMAELDSPRQREVQATAILRRDWADGHGQAELDPIDDRDRVESLSPLVRHVAVAIP